MADWLTQTEYAVVGALLVDQSSIGEVVEQLKPDAFSVAKIPSAMRGKMSFETYRRCVIDRVAEAVRDPLIWLRDESRVLESTLV